MAIGQRPSTLAVELFYSETRACSYCMVHRLQTRVRRGSRILLNNRATVLHQGGQCGWARGVHRWLILAQQPRRKTISCQSQVCTPRPRVYILSLLLITYVYLCIHLSIQLSIFTYIHLSIYVSIDLSRGQPEVCLQWCALHALVYIYSISPIDHVCLSIYTSIYPAIYLGLTS